MIAICAADMQATPLQMAHALLEFTRIAAESSCTFDQAVDALCGLSARQISVSRCLALLPCVLARISAGTPPATAVSQLLDVSSPRADAAQSE